MDKKNIRKLLLEQGELLSNKFISDANQKIQSVLMSEIDIKESKNNLLYFPFRKEVALDLITSELKKHANKIYMPCIISKKIMRFNLLKEDSILKKNKFVINEISNNF